MPGVCLLFWCLAILSILAPLVRDRQCHPILTISFEEETSESPEISSFHPCGGEPISRIFSFTSFCTPYTLKRYSSWSLLDSDTEYAAVCHHSRPYLYLGAAEHGPVQLLPTLGSMIHSWTMTPHRCAVVWAIYRIYQWSSEPVWKASHMGDSKFSTQVKKI